MIWERIGLLWATWKWIVILVLVLILSLWLNVYQYGRGIAAYQEGRVTAMEATIDAAREIATLAKADNTALLSRLDQIAARGERNRTNYGRAAAQAPLPTGCTPGQPRIDAINQALGPQE